MKIKEIYKDASYEVRLKAPILGIIIIFIAIAVLPMATNLLIWKLYPIATVFLLVALILFYTYFFLLRRKKYEQASQILLYVMMIAVILATQLFVVSTLNAFYVAVLGSLFSSVLVLLFSTNERNVWITNICLVIHCAIVAVRIYLRLQITPDSDVDLVAPAVVLVLILAANTYMYKIVCFLVNDALTKLRITRIHEHKLQGLTIEAKQHLQLAQDMYSKAHGTADSIHTIEDNVNNIADQIETLDTQFSTSKNALDRIAQSMEELNSVAQNQSATTEENSSALKEMVASIKNILLMINNKIETVELLQKKANDGVEIMEETATSFARVIEQIGNINDMMDLISGIATQTNLLAMNASIEAAHAGDSGKGFAVVADEVRKLAESSSKNSDEVAKSLKLLTATIGETKESVSKSGKSFNIIQSNVDTVHIAMEDIGRHIQNLSAGSDKILQTTSSMNDLTEKVQDAVYKTKIDQMNADENLAHLGSFIRSLGQNIDKIQTGSITIRESSEEVSDKCSQINNFVQAFSKKLDN